MNLTRRQWVAGTSAALLAGRVTHATAKIPAAIHVRETKIISHESQHYHGWPTLARTKSGQLLLVCSGGRESHVCPFGRVELMRSDDAGKSWSYPQVVIDSPIDDRDAGILETNKGTLLVTTFTSLAYEPILQRGIAKPGSAWPQARLDRWKAAHQALSKEGRDKQLGTWVIRSKDGGATWLGIQRCPVNSPHGPIQLTNGRILYAGKTLWKDKPVIGVCTSDDDGATWSDVIAIPTRPGDEPDKYHELHAVDNGKGTIIAHIRNHNSKNARETLQSESKDGGKTWSVPHAIGVWGLPSHLMRLKSGKLLMSYGYRRKPYGNQLRISDDGMSWSQPFTLSSDGGGHDLGYPSTVELDDGSFVSVWYELRPGTRRAALRQAQWEWK